MKFDIVQQEHKNCHRKKWSSQLEFKSGTRQNAFNFALTTLRTIRFDPLSLEQYK